MVQVKWGSVAEMIMAALKKKPMTRAQVCDAIGRDKNKVSGIITRLHRTGKRMGQRIYIANYVMEVEGSRKYPRAVYAVGTGKDATRPQPKRKKNDTGKV